MVPPQNGVWLDDEQGITPARPESGEKNPDEAILLPELRPSLPALVDRKLVA